jgi:hypothetical protein
MEEIKKTLYDLVYVNNIELANLIYFHECQLSPIKVFYLFYIFTSLLNLFSFKFRFTLATQ